MRPWRALFVLVLQLLALCEEPSISALAAHLPNGSNPGLAREISRSLFSYREDPLAEADRWSELSDSSRRQWTSSHEVVQREAEIRDVLKVTSLLADTGIKVHVEIQIVAPDDSISDIDKTRIKAYARAMRPRHHGTTLDFEVSVAPPAVYKRLSMLLPSENSSLFARYLEQIASTAGSPNVLFVILNSNDENKHHREMIPVMGPGKVAWAFFTQEEARLNVADLLRAIEVTAEQIFHPIPLYYPISVIQDLKVELVAYTPGRDHKAQWLKDFAWDQFEANLRGMAVHGQRLRFSSLQINAECSLCARAFHGVHNPSRNFMKKAAAVLSGESGYDQAWIARMPGETSQRSSAEKVLRLFVLDTFMIRQGKALERLESVPLSLFPGMGIITLRSSDKSSVAALQILLAQGFLASAYGIGNPELYLSSSTVAHQGHGEVEPSSVVFDVVTRNLVRSITELRLNEIGDIVRGILYFDVDPAKALGESEYSKFRERLNLLLYKLVEAQKMAGVSSDAQAGLYLAFSTRHDIRSLRASFDIEEHSKTVEKFRDPTLRCHFSRLKREALRASRILESRHPSLWQIILAVGSFGVVTTVWWLLLEQRLRLAGQDKTE